MSCQGKLDSSYKNLKLNIIAINTGRYIFRQKFEPNYNGI